MVRLTSQSIPVLIVIGALHRISKQKAFLIGGAGRKWEVGRLNNTQYSVTACSLSDQ